MKKYMYTIIAAATVGLLALTTYAYQPGESDLHCRVIDVGAGQCAVIKIPGDDQTEGDYYIVYDTGNFQDGGKSARDGIFEIIPTDEVIDLMILSHTDSDHVAATPEIFEKYQVMRVIRAGMFRTPYAETLKDARGAITHAVEQGWTIDSNLSQEEMLPGSTTIMGDARVTFVCGFSVPPHNWDIKNKSERNNAGSIVIRIEYNGGSILFCGDAVGRHLNETNQNKAIATEKYMVDNAKAIIIDSDVIIAPHHGSNGSSSGDFIRAVSPEFVIFSAGHKHEHPTAGAANRYLANGVAKVNMFRTDLGDDEDSECEWDHGQVPNHSDPIGDDDVEVMITKIGVVTVKYRNAD